MSEHDLDAREPGAAEHATYAEHPTAWERYRATIRRHWEIPILGLLVGAALGWLVHASSTPTYEATAKVLVGQQAPVDALLGAGTTSANPERELRTTVALIGLDPVAERVRERLRLRDSPRELLDVVDVELESGSNIIDITARVDDPDLAARLANAFATSYRDLQAAAARDSVAAALRAGEERLRRLGPDADRTELGARLNAEVRRLQILGAFQVGGVRIVRPATAPDAASGLTPLGASIAGAVVGLLAAAVLLIVIARADTRLHDEAGVARALGVPVLAAVPRRRWGSRRPLPGDDDEPRSEALATLAARIAFSRARRPPGMLLIASPEGGDDTPQLVLGLADALSVLGRSALAIETDLREPHFASLLGAEPPADLVAVLLERASLGEALVGVSSVAAPIDGQRAGDGGAWAMVGGGPVAQPQALLGGPTMADVAGRARLHAEFVLLSGAPLSRVGDALALASVVDACLLVVRQGRTSEETARRALRSLETLDVAVLGAVLTGVPRRSGWRRSRRRVERRRGGEGPREPEPAAFVADGNGSPRSEAPRR